MSMLTLQLPAGSQTYKQFAVLAMPEDHLLWLNPTPSWIPTLLPQEHCSLLQFEHAGTVPAAEAAAAGSAGVHG